MKGRISKRLALLLENEKSRQELIEALTEVRSEATIEVDNDKYKVAKVITLPLPGERTIEKNATKAEN